MARRARSEPSLHVTPIAHDRAASWGVALVEALIGYTWLLSALNKMLNPGFRTGLAAQLTMAMRGNPNTWWVALSTRLVLPHAQLCAVLVEVGELLVALGFFAGAALWASGQFPMRRWARRLNLGVLGALMGGALMTANYYVMSGATLPGLDPANAFYCHRIVIIAFYAGHRLPGDGHRTVPGVSARGNETVSGTDRYRTRGAEWRRSTRRPA